MSEADLIAVTLKHVAGLLRCNAEDMVRLVNADRELAASLLR